MESTAAMEAAAAMETAVRGNAAVEAAAGVVTAVGLRSDEVMAMERAAVGDAVIVDVADVHMIVHACSTDEVVAAGKGGAVPPARVAEEEP